MDIFSPFLQSTACLYLASPEYLQPSLSKVQLIVLLSSRFLLPFLTSPPPRPCSSCILSHQVITIYSTGKANENISVPQGLCRGQRMAASNISESKLQTCLGNQPLICPCSHWKNPATSLHEFPEAERALLSIVIYEYSKSNGETSSLLAWE